MILATPSLIGSVDPRVRKSLVAARVKGMRGDLVSAIDMLRKAIQNESDDKPTERAVLGLVLSELLHLNRDDRSAIDEMKKLVLPLADMLAPQDRFVIEENLFDMEMESWSEEGLRHFYELVDRRRVVGLEWDD